MPEELQRTGDHPPERGTLFDATSRLAGEAAARSVGSRREKILRYLTERGPATLFEIAAHYDYFDHQISGRFTELAKDGLIVRTGERRQKPETGCVADVWRLADRPESPPKDLGDLQGYPTTLNIPGEGLFQRWPIMERDELPGLPYVVHQDAAGLKLHFRVSLVECDGCGRPVKLVCEAGKKTYRCGTPGCNRVWHLQLVREPGKAEMLALIMKTL